MNCELELIRVQAERLRWMITQLENSCDGTAVMIAFINHKREQLKETLEQLTVLS